MILYARQPRRFALQLSVDLFVLIWSVVWILLGAAVHAAISALAGPALRAADAARTVKTDLAGAAGQAGEVPAIGDQLRRPFDSAASSLDPFINAALNQAANIERLAVLVGILIAVLPISLVLLLWLPRRLRFAREFRSARSVLAAPGGLELLALRSLTSQPLSALVRVGPDPVGAWRAGDRQVLETLAAAELRRCGLELTTTPDGPAPPTPPDRDVRSG